jgi:proteasome lid subunit RPN8/RPN11
MTLKLNTVILHQIKRDGELAYPEEGAGFLLGYAGESERRVVAILPVENAREDAARHKRYLIQPKDMLRAEDEAERRGLTLLGVYHSHPDHPARPSGFDRDWALPWFSYIITRVEKGRATQIRSWRLQEDRCDFDEEALTLSTAPAENAGTPKLTHWS